MGLLRNLLPPNEPPFTDQNGSDAALVAQAKCGDAQAFALLYHRYVERVYDFCAHRLSSTEAAEDATQTVFLRAVTSLSQCREEALFAGWLFAIARNVVNDSYRSRRIAEQPLPDIFEVEDPSDSLEDQALRSEWNRELSAMRDECLTGSERELLDLRLQGLTDKEIAVALGRSHGAIRVAQHRMVHKLRDCLDASNVHKEVAHVD